MAVRNLPDDTTNGIAAINNALATGALSFPGATQVYNKETGVMFTLQGLGTSAQFVAGGGAAGSLTAQQVAQVQRRLTPYLGAVANRCYQPTGKHGSNKGYNCRTAHQFKDDVVGIYVLYPNYYLVNPITTGTETTSGGDATLKLGLERVNTGVSAFTQALFAGAVSGTIPSGGMLASDFIPTPGAKAGEWFYLRPNFYSPNGQIIFSSETGWNLAPLGEGNTPAAGVPPDLTMGGALGTATTTNYYPVAIYGLTSKGSVVVFGDSRDRGVGDVQDMNGSGETGQAARAIAAQYGVINCGVGSDRLRNFLSNSANRRQLAQFCSHIVIGTGINDIRDNRTAADLLTDIQSLVSLINTAYPGKKIYIKTLGPITSSTDSWATDANQTIDGTNTRRVAYNNLLRTTFMPGVAGIIDAADAIETYRDSGKYKSNGVAFYYTGDGLHESQTGYLALANTGIVIRAMNLQ